ncbi:amino acid adenylation domain-containing protein [Streptomyces sp. RY43-2]|uniref:Amino acid adenylation domain-containing protein n=1 Tax=Streptomyces macrolidinus TaxID=2952607 RepID=A0ABT0ZCE3_9ACTN|nr:amino acid adenylation domain-containing protein [Streptomyces macrolidinus]MCN9241197.1 amino acid adenylation domain-containing protein [Streptomyces macrolidinus]
MSERPAPEGERSAAELREAVAAIWRDALGLDDIRDGCNFFDEGGDSVLSVEVAISLRELTGQDLELDILYDYPEFGALAAALGAGPEEEKPETRELTAAEERLWTVEQLHPGSAVYHLAVRYRFPGGLDVTRLRAALDTLAARHEALRRGFVKPALALTARKVSVACRWVDARGVSETSVRELVDTEVRTPFDLGRPPLLRALVVDRGDAGSELVLTVHHLVCDGVSLDLLETQLQELYEDTSGSGGTGWEREPVGRQAVSVRPRDAEAALDHWRTMLADCPGALSLPHDLPRPARLGVDGAAHHVVLTDEQVSALVSAAEEERLSPFMMWVAAYVTALVAVTGDRDLVLAVPASSRGPAQAGEVGMFVDTLPLRFVVRPGATARDVLRLVRRVVTGALAHQQVSFQTLVEEVGSGTDRSRAPLAQTALTYMDTTGCGLRWDGHRAEREQIGTGTAKYEALWLVTRTSGGTVCELEYSTDLFTDEAAAALHRRMLAAVDAAFAQPDAPLPSECGTDAPGVFVPIHERVHRQAVEQPGAVAVRHGRTTLTYGELDRRASVLAAGLRAAGIGRGATVAVPMERGIASVTTCLGILYAGAAYLPVDIAQPAERTRHIVRTAATAAVVTDDATADLLAEVVPTHLLEKLLVTDEAPMVPAAVTDADVAYVICTSGSTGRPKAVVVPHRAVVRLVPDADFVTFGPADRVAHVSNPAFDAATLEIWGALAGGGTLVVADRDVLLSPRRMRSFLTDEGISVMFLTVTLLNQMVDFAPDAFRELRVLLFGGEKHDARRLAKLFAAGPPATVVNGYGPTENTTFSTTHEVTAEDLAEGVVPLGRPLPRSTAYVLDASGQRVGTGGTGELYVGGEGLAHGYLDAPAQTAAAFVPDPFAGRPGQRLYRTGDQVRVLPGERYEYVGRLDDQVKVRGHRVELAEIEAAVRRRNGVADAVVHARPTDDGIEILAFVAPETAGDAAPRAVLDVTVLGEELRGELPQYMLPTVIVVDHIPVTANGKADREALLSMSPAANTGDVDGGCAPPQDGDPVDATVAALWQEVLDTGSARPEDNFLNVGGHSIKAMRLLALIGEELDVTIDLVDFFEDPTLHGLTALVRRELTGDEL